MQVVKNVLTRDGAKSSESDLHTGGLEVSFVSRYLDATFKPLHHTTSNFQIDKHLDVKMRRCINTDVTTIRI